VHRNATHDHANDQSPQQDARKALAFFLFFWVKPIMICLPLLSNLGTLEQAEAQENSDRNDDDQFHDTPNR
jgi:hypothetical protein